MTDASTAAPGPGLNASQLRRNNPLRGIAFLCLGVLAFSFHDVAVKWVSGGYPLSEVLFVRSATAFPLMLGMVHLDAGLRSLLNPQFAVALVRALILLVAYLAYYMALSAMPLAEAVALYSSVPLIIVALAGPLLGEQIGIVRWVAVVVGFIGVIIMLRPGLGVFEPAGLLFCFAPCSTATP